jgi:hypothetical protein
MAFDFAEPHIKPGKLLHGLGLTNKGTKRVPRKWKKHRMTDPEEHYGRDDLERRRAC